MATKPTARSSNSSPAANSSAKATPAQRAAAKAKATGASAPATVPAVASAPATVPAVASAPARGTAPATNAPKALRYTPGPLPTHVQLVQGKGSYKAPGAANAYAALVAACNTAGGAVAAYLANCAACKASGQPCNGPVPTLRYFMARGVCLPVAAPVAAPAPKARQAS
jgi:hypothetical protein